MLQSVSCPYCGEPVSIAIDEAGGSLQQYVEDCRVCCQPWEVTVRIGGEVEVHLRTLDE
ncbi:MAG TPA: CPXCG motif-containing cysteine-rich protein [Thermoanaerobaculia bacterium]|nr:CPXCG motif-containing cysteine-rich protein [Thermoanaerobaculia bacterium]